MKTIQNGDTIYIGEEDLDFTMSFPGAIRLVHYSDFAAGSIDNQIDISGSPAAFDIHSGDVGSITGAYYLADAAGVLPGLPWVEIKSPAVSLDVLMNGTTNSVDGKDVTRDMNIDFRILNNLGGLWAAAPTMNIEITTPGGGKLMIFNGFSLVGIPINTAQVRVVNIPLAGAEAGTYSAQAKWPSTASPVGTGFYNKGYNSNSVNFEVTTRSISIESNKDSLLCGDTFVVTIHGESNHQYFVFIQAVEDTPDSGYPLIPTGQPGIISGAVLPIELNNATLTSQASITTTADGSRPVLFYTNLSTRCQIYTIVVLDSIVMSRSASVQVEVMPGSVTVMTAGSSVYYLGEEIMLSGTNTESETTWLYLVGQNLGNGNGVKLDNLTISADDPALAADRRMVAVAVNADDTWAYTWNTRTLGLVPADGVYVIYAVAEPRAKNELEGVKYATASIGLKYPYVSAAMNRNHIIRGEEWSLSGTATGNPERVYIWIVGPGYASLSNPAIVGADGSFEFRLNSFQTANLGDGQYHVLVQHPMMNGRQDPRLAPGTTDTIATAGGVLNISQTLESPDGLQAVKEAFDANRADDIHYWTGFAVGVLPSPESMMLSPGWNFVSTPRPLSEGSNTAAIFQHIDTDGHSVFLYNGSAREWYAMKINDEVRPLDGIWIYSNSTASVLLHYRDGAAAAPSTKYLFPGWNAIGFGGSMPATAHDTLLSVSPKWSTLLGWDGSRQQYEIAIVSGGTGSYADSRIMTPLKGYWLFMKESGELAALSA